MISFRRIDKKGNEIIVVCNFQPMLRENYCIGVPFDGTYSEVFNTDAQEFGGSGITNGTAIVSEEVPMHGLEQSITLTLPPMSVLYLKCVRKKPKRNPKALTDAAKKTTRKTKAKASADDKTEEKPKAKKTAAKTKKAAAKPKDEAETETK